MPKIHSAKPFSYVAKDQGSFRVLQETGILESGQLKYRAKLCELRLEKEGSEEYALMRCMYYERAETDERRPITLCFNGGPGSSSVWLHMGALGPKRVKTDEVGYPFEKNGRYELEDNEDTLLETTDLIFIDPIGTGWSRAFPYQASENYWGVDDDVASIGLFTRLFLRHFGRASDPLHIVGESYGTTRAAALAEHLQTQHRISCKTITLVSMVLRFPTIVNEDGQNEQVFANLIPTMAMAGHFHQKLSPENLALDRTTLRKKAQTFVREQYLPFLERGYRVTDNGEMDAMASKLGDLIGIDAKVLKKHHGRLGLESYIKLLLDDEAKTVGAYDARIQGPTMPAEGDGPDELYEPSAGVLEKAVSGLFYDYTASLFDTEGFDPYETLNYEIFAAWRFGEGQTEQSFDVSARLQRAMQADPKLRIHIACGVFDLVTPVHAAETTIDHFRILYDHPALRQQISFGYYEGGHMMYTVPSEKHALLFDIKQTMRNRLGLTSAETHQVSGTRATANRYALLVRSNSEDDLLGVSFNAQSNSP